ncbi:MAG TPA: DsbA family protein [Gammaproteobacteria bacterium]|nr:DsbA family protein [Gammaproteobacteria bacterium]
MNEDTQTVDVDFYSDFASPYCFLAALRLEKLARQKALATIWVAFLVRPQGSGPLTGEKLAEAEAQREAATATLKQEFGLKLNPGPIGLDPYDAHLAMAHASREGKSLALGMALMRAYWLEGKAIDDRQVIEQVAVAAGVTAEEMRRAWDDERNAYFVRRGMEIGVGHGIQSVPTYIVGRAYLVQGAADYAHLEETVRTVKEERRKAG